MTVQDDGPCIYWKQQGSSKEHVAPSSLGGNCTLNCVCVKCNGDLSEVDQALAEHSPVALSKIQNTPASAFPTQLGSYFLMEAEGNRQLGVRIGYQFPFYFCPQLFATGDRVQVFASDRDG